MCQVNVFQAKTELSRLLVMLEDRAEDEIIIARNGKPVARMVRWEQAPVSKRIGIARGLFSVPADSDEEKPVIVDLFSGGMQ